MSGTVDLAQVITISVVSHGHGNLLRNLLRDLDAKPTLARVPVIVTLNVPEAGFAPTDYTNLVVTIIRNSVPKGFGANHNAAFAQSTTRWFVILNPDLRLSGDEPFSQLATYAAAVPGLAVIAPRIVASDGALEDSVRANLTPASLLRRRGGDRDTVDPARPTRIGAPFYWLAGMCMMVDAAAFRAVGGFDERIFLYCEDYDLCARLYLAGYALAVDPAVSVVHDAQRDSHRSARHLRWHLASLLRIWTGRAFWRVTLSSGSPRR